jgi:hypothetical protein
VQITLSARVSDLGRRLRRSWLDRHWYIAICGFVLLAEFYVFFVLPGGPTVELRGNKPLLVREFGQGSAIGQTFVPLADNLNGLRLWFAVDGEPIAATLECELQRDEGQGLTTLHRWSEELVVRGRTSHIFSIPLVRESKDRLFRFDFRVSGPSRAGLALEGSYDNPGPGALIIDDRTQWGDARFETRTATLFEAFMAETTRVPWPLHYNVMALVIFLMAYNWAAMTFMYYMVVVREPEW